MEYPLTFEEYFAEMGLYELPEAEIEAKYKEAVSFLFWMIQYNKVDVSEVDRGVRGKNCSERGKFSLFDSVVE